jgi:hypothetical protein
VCGVVNHCSLACQVLHWKMAHNLLKKRKMAHKADCTPMDRWLDAANANP